MARGEFCEQFRELSNQPDESPVQRRQWENSVAAFTQWQFSGASQNRGLPAGKPSKAGLHTNTPGPSPLFRAGQDLLKSVMKKILDDQTYRKLALGPPDAKVAVILLL